MDAKQRIAVLKRDGYRCTNVKEQGQCTYTEKAGAKDSSLEAHHVVERFRFKDDENLAEELGYICDSKKNLSTLCYDCHKDYHTFGIELNISGIMYKAERKFNFNWRVYKKQQKELRRLHRQDWARIVSGIEIQKLVYWLYHIAPEMAIAG